MSVNRTIKVVFLKRKLLSQADIEIPILHIRVAGGLPIETSYFT
jgi:hypothetical protein